MFENKEITKEKIKDIMYAVRNEFENEVDDIDNVMETEITDRELDLMFKFLDMFIGKTKMVIDDEVEDTRKYFDYELAYNMYKKVRTLFNKGGFKAVEEVFDIDDSGRDNGYIIVKDELNAYNTEVYLINKNFDTDKEEEFYVSGEVDMYSYSGGDDNLYINDIDTIEDRIGRLLDYAKENDYTIEDYEKELESLEKVLEKITIKDDDLLF